MKSLILSIILSVLMLNGYFTQAQYPIITFDEIPMPGPQMDYTQTIDTGNYIIELMYWGYNRFYGRKNADSSYMGFTYSNIQDSITPGLLNDRAAFPAVGARSSAQYGVCHGASGMSVDMYPGVKPTLNAIVYSVYITNATCAVWSMEHGDSLAKKFGGVNGTDPDWFLLKIKGYNFTTGIVDSVLFYLADFRSDTPAMDYIVKNWTQVDLSSLGQVDSLSFLLSSSDTGSNGMNTPAYFCIDEIGVEGGGSIDEITQHKRMFLYPNPVPSQGRLFLDVHDGYPLETYTITGYTIIGKPVLQQAIRTGSSMDISSLQPGIYFFTITDAKRTWVEKQKIRLQ